MRIIRAAFTVALIALALGFGTIALLYALFLLAPGFFMEKVGTITGTVKYDGKPVLAGIITFYHPRRGIEVSTEIEGGEYTAQRVPTGLCIVTVNTAPHRQTWHILKKQRELSGGRLPQDLNVRLGEWGIERLSVLGAATAGLLGTPFGQGPLLAASALIPERTGTEEEWDKVKDMINVPEKYADPKTSDLTYTVSWGKQGFDIDLPKK